MTVRELIEHLLGYPLDAQVYDIDGMSIVSRTIVNEVSDDHDPVDG